MTQDSFDARDFADIQDLIEDYAVGRWSAADEAETPDELPDTAALFERMNKEALIDRALALSEDLWDVPIWDGDAQGTCVTKMRGLTTMKKAQLVSYVANAFLRALPSLISSQKLSDCAALLQLAQNGGRDTIALPTLYRNTDACAKAVQNAQIYDNLIMDGLVVPVRLCKTEDMARYRLTLPREAYAYSTQPKRDLLAQSVVLDIVHAYIKAAVNLYGIVTTEDLARLLNRYETQIANGAKANGGFSELDQNIADQKARGELDAYRKNTTIRANIAAICAQMPEQILLLQCRYASLQDALFERMQIEIDGQAREVLVNCELFMRDEDEEASYQRIYAILEERRNMPMYYPATYAALMRYAHQPLNDDVPALATLRRLSDWFVKEHAQDIKASIRDRAARLKLPTPKSIDMEAMRNEADRIAAQIYMRTISNTLDLELRDDALVLPERCGIVMRDLDDANAYFRLCTEMQNNSRLFSNYGATPTECRKRAPAHEGPTKIVFGPGLQGTDVPEQIREAIARSDFGGAFIVDEPKPQKAPKIGRNDPCPCGSGKKYKQCCGKNK